MKTWFTSCRQRQPRYAPLLRRCINRVVIFGLILCLVEVARPQNSPFASWRYLFGDTGFTPFDVALDSSANSYAVFTTTLGSATETNSVWVVKLNSAGTNELYRLSLATLSFHHAKAVAVDATGQAVVLWTGGLTKIDSAGTAIVYNTWLGIEDPSDVAVDDFGNAYVVGKIDQNGVGNREAVVAKIDANGVMEWVRTIGGSATDVARGIGLGPGGEIYLVGQTSSLDFPTTSSGRPFSGGDTDAFVVELDAQGALIYSTCLGGGGSDEAQRIKVDNSGNSYVVGTTSSADFPILSPFQSALRGSEDVFVAKITVAGLLSYSSFLGGSASDQGVDIAVDSMGNASVTGVTYSADFPTFRAAQDTFAGNWQAFITTLNSLGSLTYSSYDIGGATQFHQGTTISYDSADNLFVGILNHGYEGGGEHPALAKFARDNVSPAISITAPIANATYLLNQASLSNFGCSDSDAGIFSCTGSVSNGTPIDTGTIGTKTFSVTATDWAGNSAMSTATYTVTYRTFMLYNTTQAFNTKTKSPEIKIQLQDASGTNKSSAAVSIAAIRVTPRGNPSLTTKTISGAFTFDSTLTYPGSAAGGGYKYTLDPSGLASGAYDLIFSVAGDPVLHTAPFSIK